MTFSNLFILLSHARNILNRQKKIFELFFDLPDSDYLLMMLRRTNYSELILNCIILLSRVLLTTLRFVVMFVAIQSCWSLYNFWLPLNSNGSHREDGGHNRQMRHEVSQATEVGSELPISLITFVKIKIYKIKCTVLVLHENEIEDAVKDGVYQVCESQVEDEEVCNSSHSLVS